ncbi:MAG TPA: gliding motility-associated C-terminal domain-containing protein, partial [Saprospiraceae bacterium]|nr:gliding motility-associated C-terminal domain-containing protein [Saprospiraceae bacterium]
TCKGGSDGSIVANVSGGIGPYSYKWTPQVPPLDSKIYSNIPAGFYNLTVTDTGNPGCTKVVTQIEVKDGEDFKITATVTQAECNCTGGSILINSMGGTPVLFAWTPFVPSKNPNDNIPCGLYSVVVTSQGGCQKTLTNIEVTAKSSTLSVFADVFNPKCFGGCDGLISAAVSPNDPNATFKWNDQYHQNTQTADSLCAGVYIVTATDSEGCTKTASFELADPAEIILSTSSDSASSPNSKNGKAIVTANGGTGAYTYKWNTIPPQVTSIATGLGKGSYTVTVTDGNGCTKSAIVIVGAKDTTIITPVDTSNVLIINLLAGIYHNYGISCQGECDGTIKAIPPSKAVPPLSYAWSGSASSQKGQTAIQLCAGSYNVVITDANGAKFTSKQAITLTAPPSLNLQVVTGLNPTPTATALVDGGVAPYSYKLNEGPYSSVNIFNIDCNFPVSILALDANGCQAIQTIPGPCTTDCNEARLVITPNGDDINEYFVLGCANNYPCNKLTIFDRFGRIMYVKSGYLNDWNGVDNTGIPLPEGGYFWAFEYYHQIPCPNLLTVKPYVAKGSITIVR